MRFRLGRCQCGEHVASPPQPPIVADTPIMRLWTLHPRYLDAKGLVAAWREALLAQKVLEGGTRGYRHHPQLQRFQAQRDPVAGIAEFLRGLASEADRRGYHFDSTKISRRRVRVKIDRKSTRLNSSH